MKAAAREEAEKCRVQLEESHAFNEIKVAEREKELVQAAADPAQERQDYD